MDREPVRWLDSSESPELLALMRVGAEELAPQDALARIGERLQASALASKSEPVPPDNDRQGALTRAGKLGLGKLALGLTVLLGMAGLALYFSLHESLPAPLPSRVSTAQVRKPAAEVPSAAAPAADTRTEAPLEPQVVLPPPSSVVEQAAVPKRREHASRAQRRTSPSAPRVAPSDTRLLEARLLEQARKELSMQPSHALVLLREHATKYPTSWLEEERTALLIRALVETGQRDQARAQLTQFKTRFSTSPHTDRLERLLR